MPRRDLRLLLAVCLVAVVWALAQSVVGLSSGFLFLAPALVMALPLLAGRYIGADRLTRITRAVPPPRRGVVVRSPVCRRFRRVPPRGGLLIAASLAVRPPPPVASAR